MFDIFGNFNSAEDINQTAISLRSEKELDNLMILARENGIDLEIAEAFYEGELLYLCDDTSAAIGKLEVERHQLKSTFLNHIMDHLIGYLCNECIHTDFAKAVRSNSKELEGCSAHIKKEATRALGGKNGVISDRQVYQYAKDYYLKGGKS